MWKEIDRAVYAALILGKDVKRGHYLKDNVLFCSAVLRGAAPYADQNYVENDWSSIAYFALLPKAATSALAACMKI